VAQIDEAMIAAIDEVAQAIAERVSETADSRTIGKAVVDRLRTKYGTEPMRKWLTDIGVERDPPFDEWSAVSWPYLKTILSSAECEAFLDRLAAEAFSA